MNRSLVVAKDEWLVTYGNTQAEERLLKGLRHGVELGMPTVACLNLKVFPIGTRVRAGDDCSFFEEYSNQSR